MQNSNYKKSGFVWFVIIFFVFQVLAIILGSTLGILQSAGDFKSFNYEPVFIYGIYSIMVAVYVYKLINLNINSIYWTKIIIVAYILLGTYNIFLRLPQDDIVTYTATTVIRTIFFVTIAIFFRQHLKKLMTSDSRYAPRKT